MERSTFEEQSWKRAALSKLSTRIYPTHSPFPSFWRQTAQNHPNSLKLHIPYQEILFSCQADLSLTTAIFYELDSLSSQKSCPSFPVALCKQSDQGKASKSLGKRPGGA